MTENVTVIPAKPSTNALYTKAEAILREKHQAEFNQILDDLYAEAGMTRKKRLTAAEKAEAKREAARVKAQAELTKIHAQFPDLFGEVAAEPAEGSAEVG